MRVRVFYHDKCFDGACSASLFTRFHRECIDSSATYEYHGLLQPQSADQFLQGRLQPAIAGFKGQNSMSSLKEIISQDLTVDKSPELFCFGLLEEFDISLLTSLVSRSSAKN